MSSHHSGDAYLTFDSEDFTQSFAGGFGFSTSKVDGSHYEDSGKIQLCSYASHTYIHMHI